MKMFPIFHTRQYTNATWGILISINLDLETAGGFKYEWTGQIELLASNSCFSFLHSAEHVCCEKV